MIIRIDGEDARGFGTQDCVDRLRGPRGERVLVTVERAMESGGVEELELEVVRDVIHTPAVEAEMLDDGIGWVRIRSFQSNTGGELRSAVDRLQRDHGAELSGMVLDLRNNPGGLLSEAVSVADAFLTDGRIVARRASRRDESVSEATIRDATAAGGGVVNGGSASASEIGGRSFAAAQRSGRRRTGRAASSRSSTCRTARAQADDLTLPPSGRSIDGEGITPDLVVAASEDPTETTTEGEAAAEDDPQLAEAIRVLLNQDAEPPTTDGGSAAGAAEQVE